MMRHMVSPTHTGRTDDEVVVLLDVPQTTSEHCCPVVGVTSPDCVPINCAILASAEVLTTCSRSERQLTLVRRNL